MKQDYVLGFVFDPTGEAVLLQLKKKPDWMRNRFNGIGGHVEPGEAPGLAMSREAGEEAGLGELSWQQVCELRGEGFCIYVYASFTEEIGDHEAPGGSEMLKIVPTDKLPASCIPNLHWLIPMALSLTRGESAQSFVVTEQSRS
jgi:8-oxo-dGTP pyrophosphatase MutT (NUDIX family)